MDTEESCMEDTSECSCSKESSVYYCSEPNDCCKPQCNDPTAYEEFDTYFNGTQLTIRVFDRRDFKSGHGRVGNTSPCSGQQRPDCDHSHPTDCEILQRILRSSKFGENLQRKRIVRECACVRPKDRRELGCIEKYRPMYRMSGGGYDADDCGAPEAKELPDDACYCCYNIYPKDDNDMPKRPRNNAKTSGRGRICQKSCEGYGESHVCLISMNSKRSCERKMDSLNIELKTPVIPIPCRERKCATETFVDDRILNDYFIDPKPKGKKKKGKGKKK